MNRRKERRLTVLLATLSIATISCTTALEQPTTVPHQDPALRELSILVNFRNHAPIPEGSRIVIMDIAGECAEEVKDALMRRLIDNTGYNVLTRENLEQIMIETDLNWEARFNTETAAKLGELLGASLFIVGRVTYCGQSASDLPDNEFGVQFNILAALQIIDLETGRVIFSSANEGVYVPVPAQLLTFNASGEPLPTDQAPDTLTTANNTAVQPARFNPIKNIKNLVGGNGSDPPEAKAPAKKKSKPEPEAYLKIKAAEDMVNGFADKFFSRPMWEPVEMWSSPEWKYGESVRYVRLGQCAEAVALLMEADNEVPYMHSADVAKYLHNYGVALLCANRPEDALQKLRAAYRIDYAQTTLKMLGLAAKITEWSLEVQDNTEPVVDTVLRRGD